MEEPESELTHEHAAGQRSAPGPPQVMDSVDSQSGPGWVDTCAVTGAGRECICPLQPLRRRLLLLLEQVFCGTGKTR